MIKSTPAEFRFKGKALILAWLGFLISLCGVLGTVWLIREGLRGGASFLMVSFSFIAFSGWLLLTGRSDIVIDDEGISRRLFGRTWQSIAWKNVRRITEFPIFNPDLHKMSRAFNIYPSVFPRFRLVPSGKMAFMEPAENAHQLVELIEHYAAAYRIELENRVSATTSFR